jgi:hypothetical protein
VHNEKTSVKMTFENKIKTLGIYQLIGGILGILITIRYLPNFSTFYGGLLLLFLIIFSLQSFSVYCGYLLLKKKILKGLNLSIYNQFIQIISFGVLGFYFKYSAGIYAGIKLNLTNDTIFTFMAGLSTTALAIDDYIDFKELSINFIALIIINFIFNLKSEFEKRIGKK